MLSEHAAQQRWESKEREMRLWAETPAAPGQAQRPAGAVYLSCL